MPSAPFPFAAADAVPVCQRRHHASFVRPPLDLHLPSSRPGSALRDIPEPIDQEASSGTIAVPSQQNHTSSFPGMQRRRRRLPWPAARRRRVLSVVRPRVTSPPSLARVTNRPATAPSSSPSSRTVRHRSPACSGGGAVVVPGQQHASVASSLPHVTSPSALLHCATRGHQAQSDPCCSAPLSVTSLELALLTRGLSRKSSAL